MKNPFIYNIPVKCEDCRFFHSFEDDGHPDMCFLLNKTSWDKGCKAKAIKILFFDEEIKNHKNEDERTDEEKVMDLENMFMEGFFGKDVWKSNYAEMEKMIKTDDEINTFRKWAYNETVEVFGKNIGDAKLFVNEWISETIKRHFGKEKND